MARSVCQQARTRSWTTLLIWTSSCDQKKNPSNGLLSFSSPQGSRAFKMTKIIGRIAAPPTITEQSRLHATPFESAILMAKATPNDAIMATKDMDAYIESFLGRGIEVNKTLLESLCAPLYHSYEIQADWNCRRGAFCSHSLTKRSSLPFRPRPGCCCTLRVARSRNISRWSLPLIITVEKVVKTPKCCTENKGNQESITSPCWLECVRVERNQAFQK